MDSNAWLAGFTEADGYFGVVISEFKPKSDTRKRSKSRTVKCRFVIEQRQFDKPTNSSCQPFMEEIAKHFQVSLLTSTRKNNKFLAPAATYYLSIETIEKLSRIIDYFSIYPLRGVKGLDYQDFSTVYHMIKNGDHLTDLGSRLGIKKIVAGMNKNRK